MGGGRVFQASKYLPNIWERNHKCMWSAVTPLGPSIAMCNAVPERRDAMSVIHMCDAPCPTDISQALMHMLIHSFSGVKTINTGH